MLKARKKEQQNKGKINILGAVCLVLALVYALAYFAVFDNGVLRFADKLQTYLLGKGAFLLPLTLGLAAVQLLVFDKLYLLNKKAFAYFMVMLCLLGTAHHVFITAGEELAPASLPVGGGLVGGLIALGLHRTAGDLGTVAVLAALWIVTLVLVLPLRKLHSIVKNALFGKPAPDAAASASTESKKGTKVLPFSKSESPRAGFRQPEGEKAQTAAPGAAAPAELQNIYNNEEFTSFTDGLQKPSAFKRILSFNNDSVYEQEPVKREIERDPVQLPEWEERKNQVVYRPVINYDAIPEQRARDGAESGYHEEPDRDASVTEQYERQRQEEPRSVIFNAYRQQENGSEQRKESLSGYSSRPTFELEDNADAKVFSAKEDGQPKVTIYDSADKVGSAGSTHNSYEQEASLDAGSSSYLFPPLTLLDAPKTSDPASYESEIMEQCSVLEQTLMDFKVRAKVIAVTRGPSVTRFELEPAPGVKVSSVVNLADDIALRLAAPGVRIEAPIPGKSAIGIEAPNIKNDTVCLREVVDAAVVQQASSKLCIGLGKDISGDIISADLAKMPHLLVAGSTGSGKSVCINTIIAGILYKASPDEVKLILVDPKVVELSNYNGIPHLLTPVVTEPKKAASALHWAVAEMERRYKQFAESHVREINSYNQQAEEKMPFIVIIIDELSDLMMVAKVDVEDAILRLAQKARAAGIHLILATQRPSVDVITGIVKANIPSRIAFAVSSQTDSRTIIDMGGAEKLLGKGDMLFYPIGFNKPVRVQGAFVSDAELNKIVDFIVKQSIPVEYSEEVTAQELECDVKKQSDEAAENGAPAEDELFEDALRLVLDMGAASSSMLQRRFRIGYTRAARLVDVMEELGIVGQSVGSKPREVIMSRQEAEERFLNNV